MRYRILPADTLASMPSGTRRYDEECAKHARQVLRDWVQRNGGQDEAARILGVDQSTISRSLNVANQPALKVLIPLSKEMRWSLDQILGIAPLPPPPAVVRMSDSEVQRVAEKVSKYVARRLTPREMPAAKTPPQLPPKRGVKKDGE